MRSRAGLIFRVFLALSLAVLPWTQAIAMAAGSAEQTAMHCHADAPDKPMSGHAPGNCCDSVHCHCIAAIALPSMPDLGIQRTVAVWDAWLPLQPHQPEFAPTPPPPRA